MIELRSAKGLRELIAFWILGVLSFCLFEALADNSSREVTLENILVATQAEAETILQRLKAGESFEELAKKYSLDVTAAQGGYLGKTRLSSILPEIQAALKTTAEGEVTNVVVTPSGYMIFKVVPAAEDAGAGGMGRNPNRRRSIDGGSAVVTDVSGAVEFNDVFRGLSKPPGWDQDLQAICELKERAARDTIEVAEGILTEVKSQEFDYAERILQIHRLLAQMYSYQGDMPKAIAHFQAAHVIAAKNGFNTSQLEKQLGIAEMRRGETENCANQHNARSCILPLSPEAQHTLTSGSEKAIEYFRTSLERNPDDLEVKWLMNIAYMTLGKHPDGVPKEYVIAPSTFASSEDIGRFADVAPSLGLDTFNMAGGVIMDDFDNDGFLDLVTSSLDPCMPLRYFRNEGNGSFTERAAQAGLSKQLGGLNLVQVDYNNDGWLDIYVMRGGWEPAMGKSLLKNNGNGTFTDVTRESGLAIPATSTQTAAWLDFDNDGNVDLFVGNEFSPSQLFHNNGDGTFTDVAHPAGVDRSAFTKGVAAGDYDNDGYPDLYVSNMGEENFLYHNNRNGTFTDVARQLHVEKPIWSFPVWFFDYDNDGALDLFVAGYSYSLIDVARSYLKLPVQTETLKVYRNTGKGSFQDVTEEVGLARVFMPMGSNFGDVDNDGFLDFYLGTGSPSYGALVPNVLFRNHNGKYFVDITASSGTGHLQKGHGIAFGDINNDGDEDIFLEVGGGVPGDRYYNALFKNPGHSNHHWISLRLVGMKTNHAAIGARIKLTLENGGGSSRLICRSVCSGGSFGASPLQQHIGLGAATRIRSLEVWWPTSNSRQVFHDLNSDQFLEIREFEKDYVKLNRQTFSLGGTRSPAPHRAKQ
jgi:tetratricopeptide (TPR) repeat protein